MTGEDDMARFDSWRYKTLNTKLDLKKDYQARVHFGQMVFSCGGQTGRLDHFNGGQSH